MLRLTYVKGDGKQRWLRSLRTAPVVASLPPSFSRWVKLRGGPLESLWAGGDGRSTKKIFAQGKIK